jgi:hypothetical protein
MHLTLRNQQECAGADGTGIAVAADFEHEILVDLSPEVFRAKAARQTQQVQQSQPATLSISEHAN